jgi:hypothetical protein
LTGDLLKAKKILSQPRLTAPLLKGHEYAMRYNKNGQKQGVFAQKMLYLNVQVKFFQIIV